MKMDLVEQIQHELNLRKMMNAGRNEPDRSAVRTSWQSCGFFLPKKEQTLVTTWRR